MPRVPKPRVHQGWFVTEAGGKYTKLCRVEDGESAARAALDRLLGKVTDAPTVRALVDSYLAHCRTYYRLPSGELSSEATTHIPLSFRELLHLFSEDSAGVLTREAFKRVRQAMVDAGLSRGVVNQRVGRIRRGVEWLVEEDRLPDSVGDAIRSLKPLKPFRSAAPETEPVPPVEPDTVAATLARLAEPWASLVRLQWFSGMRPGEAVNLRGSMLAPAGRMRLAADFGKLHKMAWKGRPRVVQLGPQATLTVRPWLYRAGLLGNDPLFYSPRTGNPVLETSYVHAVQKAADEAGVQRWAPNQLRHSYLTRVRRRFGLDAAQVAGGHASANVTEIYAEADRSLAERVARELG